MISLRFFYQVTFVLPDSWPTPNFSCARPATYFSLQYATIGTCIPDTKEFQVDMTGTSFLYSRAIMAVVGKMEEATYVKSCKHG